MTPTDLSTLRAIALAAITTSLTKDNWAAFKQAFTPSICLALLDELDGLKAQLSTIRKEATDAERERAAGIAHRESARSFMMSRMAARSPAEFKMDWERAGVAANNIAKAIRAPTGDDDDQK